MYERARSDEPACKPARMSDETPEVARALPAAWTPLAGVPTAEAPQDARLARAIAAVARERRGGLLLRSKLSDELGKAKTDGWTKDKVFALLRRHGPAASDADAKAAIAALYKDGTDERWMAEKLLALGPEPLWPGADLDDRAKHA